MYNISRKVYSELVTLIRKDTKCEADKAMELVDKICGTIEKDVAENNVPTVNVMSTVAVEGKPAIEGSTLAETPEKRKERINRMVKQGLGQVDKHGNFTPTSRKVSFETVTGQG